MIAAGADRNPLGWQSLLFEPSLPIHLMKQDTGEDGERESGWARRILPGEMLRGDKAGQIEDVAHGDDRSRRAPAAGAPRRQRSGRHFDFDLLSFAGLIRHLDFNLLDFGQCHRHREFHHADGRAAEFFNERLAGLGRPFEGYGRVAVVIHAQPDFNVGLSIDFLPLACLANIC
jgi:hypothetical protein